MNKTNKIIVIIFISTFLILSVTIGIYPGFYDYHCKNRTYHDMESDLTAVFTANISIITAIQHDDMTSYSAGASGVIFDRTDGRYYALTAYHIVKNQGTYHILTTNSDTFSEYREKHADEGHISLADYYSQLPVAKIEYIYEKSDLAIISFDCSEALSVISISEDIPVKGSKIAMVGSPEGKHFEKTYGTITSNKPTIFQTNDGQSENTVLKHNAYSAPGSSGGAVFNEKMYLVGINIGGGTDVFGRFKYGVMIPCDQIQQCIHDWKND